MNSTCCRVVTPSVLWGNITQCGSSNPRLHGSSSFSSRFPTTVRLVGCEGCGSVTNLSTVGASCSYCSSTAWGQSISHSRTWKETQQIQKPCAAMTSQVDLNEQQVPSGVHSQDAKYPWLLEISIRPETVAGFKKDYEAEAKTWPSDLGTTNDFQKFEEFVISADMLARRWLPRDVVRRLAKFSHDPNQPSALVIRGLPIDEDLPPTTVQGLKLKVGKYMSEAWLMGIDRIIGQPFNLKPFLQATYGDGMGMVFKDILPHPAELEKVSQYGSSAFLDLHCDYFQCVPECWVHVLSFIGIRGDPQKVGRTLLADFREIYKRASAADIEILREQKVTWRFGPRPEDWFTQNVIVGSEDNPHIFLFDEYVGNLASAENKLIDGSPEAVAAYRRLKELGRDLAVEHGGIRLEGGDVLLLNQRRVAHGRNSFEAKFDGNDRWMQKLYVNEGQIWQPHGLVPWPERVLPYTVHKISENGKSS